MKFIIPFVASLFIAIFTSCNSDNVSVDKSLGKFFDQAKVTGCFGLMNNGTGKFTIYNLSRYRDSSYLPASTFKIVNSLIGLQTGKIVNDSMIIKWDGVKRRDEWDKDLTMYEAFRVSAVPYYQEVARRIGKADMQRYLDTLSYGTKKITTAIDTFWLDNSLKITPDEELGLVKRLYFNQFPYFFKSNQEAVKRAMLFEDNSTYRLGYKTGWSGWDPTSQRHIGWVVGWIEENNHPYFFVLNLESHDKNFDMVNVRMKLLKDILKDQGFFNGDM